MPFPCERPVWRGQTHSQRPRRIPFQIGRWGGWAFSRLMEKRVRLVAQPAGMASSPALRRGGKPQSTPSEPRGATATKSRLAASAPRSSLCKATFACSALPVSVDDTPSALDGGVVAARAQLLFVHPCSPVERRQRELLPDLLILSARRWCRFFRAGLLGEPAKAGVRGQGGAR